MLVPSFDRRESMTLSSSEEHLGQSIVDDWGLSMNSPQDLVVAKKNHPPWQMFRADESHRFLTGLRGRRGGMEKESGTQEIRKRRGKELVVKTRRMIRGELAGSAPFHSFLFSR